MDNNDRCSKRSLKLLTFDDTGSGSPDSVKRSRTSLSTFRLSQRDRELLGNAMASCMRKNDPVRQLKCDLDVLTKFRVEVANPSDQDQLRGIIALKRLIDQCCNLDLATDFHKVGGFNILVPLLTSSVSAFRLHAAWLIGELAQNHPYCQNALRNLNVLPILLIIMDSDPADAVKTKALFAISCLIRNNAELEQDFVNLYGFTYLFRATKSDYSRLSVKACFLLSVILGKQQNKEKAIEAGLVDQLARMLCEQARSCSHQTYEHTASALLALVRNCPKAAQLCRNPVLNMGAHLADQEQRSCIRELLSLLNIPGSVKYW